MHSLLVPHVPFLDTPLGCIRELMLREGVWQRSGEVCGGINGYNCHSITQRENLTKKYITGHIRSIYLNYGTTAYYFLRRQYVRTSVTT